MFNSLFVRAIKWKTGTVVRMRTNPMASVERRVGCKRRFRPRFEEGIEDRLFAATDRRSLTRIVDLMAEHDEGHRVFPGVFTANEMSAALESLSVAALDRTKAGARHLLGIPTVRSLASDSRMLEIARQFLGQSAIPFRATLFDKSPDANWLVAWHQDTALPLLRQVNSDEWGPWSTKAGVLYAHAPAWALDTVIALRLCLDDSSETNGPLRVLPDTHRVGVLTDAQISDLAQVAAPIVCTANAGGVVAMKPLTVHASSKALDDKRRRVLHIEYAAKLELGTDIELACA